MRESPGFPHKEFFLGGGFLYQRKKNSIKGKKKERMAGKETIRIGKNLSKKLDPLKTPKNKNRKIKKILWKIFFKLN